MLVGVVLLSCAALVKANDDSGILLAAGTTATSKMGLSSLARYDCCSPQDADIVIEQWDRYTNAAVSSKHRLAMVGDTFKT